MLLVLLASAMVGGCGRGAAPKADEHAGEEAGHSEEGHAEDIVLSEEAARIAGIETGVARRMTMQAVLKVPGTVTNTPQGRAVVTSPVGGQITRLFVKVGDTVRAGQAIATVRSVDVATAASQIIEAERGVLTAQAAVREAKAQVEVSLSKLQTARQTLSRQEAFAKTGAFSQPALQAAQRELGDAEAELERGRQDQTVHQAQLERAERLYTQELISRTELEQARLEVATDKIRQKNAERRIELAKATYDRERSILDRGLANSKELQTARADVAAATLEVREARIRHASAVSSVAGARKGLQAARAGYAAQAGGNRASGGSVTVVAAIGGVVTHREATLGQAVERTTEICEVENLNTVWVVARIPEKDIAKARRGATAQVTVAAYPNRIFNGVVQVVSNRLDPKTRSMPVQVLVENAGGALRADMFATVALGSGPSSSAVVIPRSALVEDGDRKVVYIAEAGGKYEEVVVEIGRVTKDQVEILSGLEPGAKVVTKGGFVLKSEKTKSELKGHEH